ncbi:Glutathione-independent glyoxalase hsp3102 [Hondaea fermentalgiana]|uniref:Glutathione-independent glyoxalase hsp3102 n=1 Tax=Hondaea fermentalgiana TaxID=2315210 RepID=A0A2R5GK05_9STRA|nr:Glutathione-independent glyoxalase hsp3102 [Hondaea fermentalgiana]|eukprot:GBG31207.1 Glutathione-independent glyoxalase hsp3102 [Hondaea fermentalgiana]
MKVLMVLTSNDKLGEHDEQTGWYLPECAHPYHVFKQAGTVEMVSASPAGGKAPVDESSVDASKEDKVSMDLYKDEAFKTFTEETKKLSDVKGDKFDAVFVVGGFGTMWDLPENADLQEIIRNTYEQGGIVSAVCHGPCALTQVKLSDGNFLVKDKKVTAFTDDEERAVERIDKIPFTNEQKLMEVGAVYTKRAAWSAHVVVDGRLITGQNPASATGVANAILARSSGTVY